jgi:hypothetical protein
MAWCVKSCGSFDVVVGVCVFGYEPCGNFWREMEKEGGLLIFWELEYEKQER